MTGNQLAEPFDISLPAISKHLKVLERAGLISRAFRWNGASIGWGQTLQHLADHLAR